MRERKIRCALLLCALLTLSACSAPSAPTATPSPVPTAAPTPTPSENAKPELLYHTETTYDPEMKTEYLEEVPYDSVVKIQRRTLDTQGYNGLIYHDIPVFDEDVPAYQTINAFFQKLQDDFFTPENANLLDAWQSVAWYSGENRKEYATNCAVRTLNEKLVSVSLCYDWYMGGVLDYGSESYTFRADTGELLSLTDLAEGTEKELRAQILEAAQTQFADRLNIGSDWAEGRPLDEYEFYVSEGKLWLHFDKYEIADGASGQFDLELPTLLKAEWL